ncbi:C4-type zinc ribbon domain-containing protein [Marinilabilia sp.]|uniref:zinc ribbon domain-containing protein n=1 Tax=Marinilabilia sp. TaxID=2021252 RepID=UPI0025C2662A|nr:C4-type zinc ribbon domain-containing protein [Marinilabilia sp.]
MDTKTNTGEKTVEDRLRALYNLQKVMSDVDKIRTLRGELPLEVQDLEDEVEGLETRITNLNSEVKNLNNNIQDKKNGIKEADLLIKKYESQQSSVRNNREFESLNKEIEFQNLEKELCKKRIKEFEIEMKAKQEAVASSEELISDRKADLESKKKELENIVSDTQDDEDKLKKKAKEIEKDIDDRLLTAFKRIRKNARNGLAVVTVERDACGGCFNKIPPQRQLDIQSRKKVIVCEYCGRVLVDSEI